MEKFAILLFSVCIAVILLRLLLIPVSAALRLLLHSVCGLLCLWLLNSVGHATGLFLPVNSVTASVAGFGGLPGIAVIALLAWMK